jgi:hypothetical protein
MNARTLPIVALALLSAACAPDSPAPTATLQGAWRAPRTSWGDPRIEGTYTNRDEFGTPFERPPELAERLREAFGPDEMAALMVERRERGRALAQTIGGGPDNDTGAGPPHWYEYLEAVNSRPWLVFEPEDGQVPELTDAGRARAAAVARSFAKRDAPDTYTDMSLYDRCITIGLPGSMMPMIYGNAYDITQAPGVVAIATRWCTKHASSRSTALRTCRPTSTFTWATRAAIGRATRSSWRRPTFTRPPLIEMQART